MVSKSLRKVRPERVTINLDKSRTLVYDLNAFAELEEEFGSIEDAMKALETGKIKSLISILWAGLVHEDEELTPKKVGSIIGLNDIQEVVNALTKAIGSSLPDAGADGEGKN